MPSHPCRSVVLVHVQIVVDSSNIILFQPFLNQVSKAKVPGWNELNDRLPDLEEMHLDKIREILMTSFPQYGLGIDGSPVFAEAECVTVRVVHKETFRIIELLIHLGLYAESLDGEAIAQHVVDTLERMKVTDDDGSVKFQMKAKDWIAVNLDRAATNVKALRLI